jgi:hypothetical protein
MGTLQSDELPLGVTPLIQPIGVNHATGVVVRVVAYGPKKGGFF